MLRKKEGFTLIELLVVIAIIGILASIVVASLNSARSKGNRAAVKGNLASLQAQSALYYDDNNASYGTAITAHSGVCDDVNTLFTDTTVAAALVSAKAAGFVDTSQPICAIGVNGQSWAVSMAYKDVITESWCTDSTGYSGDGATKDTASGGGIVPAVCG